MIKEVNCDLQMRDSWERIFRSNDPFCDPFVEAVCSRLLFYPTDVYNLTDVQYNAVINTMRALDEEYFYVSVVEWAGDFFKRGQHWWCQRPSYDEYSELPLILENALYSKSGVFGAILSHEMHGIIGGTKDFIDTLKREYPTWRKDRESIKDDWEISLVAPILDATA